MREGRFYLQQMGPFWQRGVFTGHAKWNTYGKQGSPQLCILGQMAGAMRLGFPARWAAGSPFSSTRCGALLEKEAGRTKKGREKAQPRASAAWRLTTVLDSRRLWSGAVYHNHRTV